MELKSSYIYQTPYQKDVQYGQKTLSATESNINSPETKESKQVEAKIQETKAFSQEPIKSVVTAVDQQTQDAINQFNKINNMINASIVYGG